MTISSNRWQEITPSQFQWEREALEYIRKGLPDNDPYRVWTNFEFIANDGSINEVDALIVTATGCFVVEIKSRPGHLTGDAGTWTWKNEAGRLFTDDNPILLANRKAEKLASMFRAQKAFSKIHCPFVEALVFCSAENLTWNLKGNGNYRICFRDTKNKPGSSVPGIIDALKNRKAPGMKQHVRPIDKLISSAIGRALEQIGIRPSQKSRKVGDYVLEKLIFQCPKNTYQDFEATHVTVKNVKRRVRIYNISQNELLEIKQMIQKAAEREFKDDEIKGFENNNALKEATGTIAPKLFLKGEISDTDKHLSETLRNEIYSTRRKVVGTVVNAVDDSLYSNDQMSLSWRIEEIPILSQLLYAARESGRVVIITSDHGHILDYHTKLYNYESGERWRPDDGNINDGEILIQGSRVLKPKNGKIIVPYTETIRYGKKKNGYHGGVTPQEVVIPFTIMKWQQIEKGWQVLPYYLPEWWDVRIDEVQPKTDEPILTETNKVPEKGQLPLFQEIQHDKLFESDGWINDLFKSAVLKNQKKLCGRAVLSDEWIYKFIKIVSLHEWTVIQTTLAQALGQPAMRIRGIISVMQRILNVDGYPVLTFDSASSTVKINKKLLKTQFKI